MSDWFANVMGVGDAGGSGGSWMDYFGALPAGQVDAPFVPPADSGFDFAGTIGRAVDTGLSVLDKVSSIGYQWDMRNLSMDKAKADLDMQRTYTGAATEIGKLQAQAAVNRARAEASGALFPNMDQAMANLNYRLANASSYDKLMLWLTVAGLALAWMQFSKRGR